MQKIKLKYKLLLSGFPGIKGKYEIEDFYLKSEYIDIDKYIEGRVSNEFLLSEFMSYCFLSSEKGIYINFLESISFCEFEIANKCKLNEENMRYKNGFQLLINKYPEIIRKVKNIITEIRLTLNIPVSAPVIRIYFYNVNEEYLFSFIYCIETSIWNRLLYVDENEFNSCSRFHIKLDYYLNVDNERYKRALLFFNESFDSSKKEIRFINLISCLESIFNYKLSSQESITKRVSTICANIFSVFDNKFDEYYDEFKSYYNKRSRYLHGDKNVISIEDEKGLRKRVRVIMILYMIVIKEKKNSTREMINYLNDTKKMDLQHQLLLKTLFSDSFKEQQLGILEHLKNNKIDIPKEFEEKILSNI